MKQRRVNTKASLIEKRLSEIISISVWLYLIVKIFFYDIDSYFLRTYLPTFSWAIEYKFFIILGLIVLLLFLLGTKRFFKLVAFILGYPFFLFFWRLPKLLFKNKNWMGLFVALGTSVTFFKSFSLNMAISTAVLIAGLLILVSNSGIVLYISMGVLFSYLLIHFTRRFSYSLKKFEIITKLSKSILDFWTKIKESTEQAKTQQQPARSESIEKKEDAGRANRLQWLLVLNKGCSFLISKLRYMQKSASSFIYYFVNLLGSVVVTIIVFSFLNLGLYKIDHSGFFSQAIMRFTDFFYYSSGLFFGGIDSGISAVSDLAKALSLSETCFRWLVVGILFFYLFNLVPKKHRTDIETSIVELRRQGAELEQVIKGEYQLSVDEALREVEKVKGSMLVLINYLISNIDTKQD